VCQTLKEKISRPGRAVTPVIPATQEAKIRRIIVQSQLSQKVRDPISTK
jgi:hypothetical protein